jgi:hypothetical protein
MKLKSDFKKYFWPMMRETWFESLPARAYMFGWVIVSMQLHFHIYYLLIDISIYRDRQQEVTLFYTMLLLAT